ncbi:MAG: M16 family metallopeptidase, partial [Gammaproteobacteria bacterium]
MRFLISRSRHLSTHFLGSLLLGSIFSTTSATTIPEIKFTEFKLDNGLTLIVHEDHKAPIVSVNIWYHIGSKNERPGKTGFAHLFEHLMFQGSENFDGEYLNALDEIGATDLNATTWFDRTNYFQTIPKGALDRVLFLESDRMGHLLGAIDQDKLDEQRGVVQNEKRQGDNQPYSKVWEPLLKQVFPNGHPYSWETIGSMDDLDAASLEDVQEWFKTYYGPDNAVLVIAGDIDAETALARVQHYFGDIPPGPPLNKQQVWIPAHFTERREVMQDRVPQARLYKAWTGPQWGSADANQLQLALRILGGGKNSRLYKRLVYDDQIATDVDMDGLFLEIAGLVLLEASAKPGVELATIEAAIEEEIQLFLKKGPTREELQREQTSIRANFIRGIERIGGMGGKSSVLAEYATYGGSPDLYLNDLEIIASATRKDLQNTANKWLTPYP